MQPHDSQLAKNLRNYAQFIAYQSVPSPNGNRLQSQDIDARLYALMDLLPGGRASLTGDGITFGQSKALSASNFARFEHLYKLLIKHKAFLYKCAIPKRLPKPANTHASIIACLNSALCWHGPLYISTGEKIKHNRMHVLEQSADNQRYIWTQEFRTLRDLL